MIAFKPIRIEDRAAIERYTMHAETTDCNLAFANMFCWLHVFRSAWAEVGGFLVIRFQIDGGEKIGYMQPVGEGDFAPLIPALREDAHAHGQRLRILGLTDRGRELIRDMHAGQFAFESDPARTTCAVWQAAAISPSATISTVLRPHTPITATRS